MNTISRNTFSVATIQFKPRKGLIDINRNEMLNLGTQALEMGAKVLVFPEMSLSGYLWPSQAVVANFAEPSKGKTFQRFSRFCLDNQCYFAYGFAEYFNGQYYNSQNLIGPDGCLLGTYRKVHLFLMDYNWAIPGNEGFFYVDTPLGRMGLGICMDLNYDDFVEFHIKKETQWLLFSTNWLKEETDIKLYWEKRFSGYQGSVFMANTYGFEDDWEFYGNSTVITNETVDVFAGNTGNRILLTLHNQNSSLNRMNYNKIPSPKALH